MPAPSAACFKALYYIVVRKADAVESRVVIMLYPMLGQVAAMAALLPFVYVPMCPLHFVLILLMALEIFAASLLITAACCHAPVVVVLVPMQYVQIFVAKLFVILHFGEPLDLRTVLGSWMIIAAGLLILLRSRNGQ